MLNGGKPDAIYKYGKAPIRDIGPRVSSMKPDCDIPFNIPPANVVAATHACRTCA
jgi:hypothetical protein